MRIAITGARGFIGSRLTEMLRAEGHAVVPVRRSARGGSPGVVGTTGAVQAAEAGTEEASAATDANAPADASVATTDKDTAPQNLGAGPSAGIDRDAVARVSPAGGPADVVAWDPESGWIDAAALEGMDAVVHLAGESVAARWTRRKKARIRQSRVQGTSLLARALAGLRHPPATLVSVSGVNYYGAHAPDDAVDENAPAGQGFLASLAVEWEAATAPAAAAGIRVVNARLGMVVGRGGAIGVMLPLFQIGLGGVMGSGRQVVSWIALDELAPALLHVLATPALQGPVNFVAPSPVPFAELARALGHALHRPALFRLPAFAARLALGQMGEEMVLTGVRVIPRRLLETGYRFRYPELEGALRHQLGAAA